MWSQGGMKGQNPVSSQKTWHSWALQVCLSWMKLSFARYPWKASGLSEATLCLWFSLHYTENPYFRKFQSHFILALENYVVIKSGYNTEKQLSEQRIQISQQSVEMPTVWPSLTHNPGQLALSQSQLRHSPGAGLWPMGILDAAIQSWGGGKVAYLCGHEACHNSRPWGRKESLNFFLFTVMPS